uniref:Uncharacterized protein n=1 Tax=Anguilla anguilla TaxID=7936 RepID=A0A0E9R221_ANGAN
MSQQAGKKKTSGAFHLRELNKTVLTKCQENNNTQGVVHSVC